MTRLAVIAALALAAPVAAQTDQHAGHTMPARPAGEPAPTPPTDHAADAVFDPAAMARARDAMRRENGAVTSTKVMFDLAEHQARAGGGTYRWDAEAWIGGDINRLVVKSEGEGGGALHEAEIQALYSRAIGPWSDLQAGLRHDIRPSPQRSYATLGIEGLAPYWFEVGAALFVSDKGDLLGRVEGHYDQLLTQKLILQPRVEINFAAQDVRETGVGAGLSDVEAGLRLRYELAHEFAPYVGVEWARKIGDTADFARAAGDDPDVTSFVVGVRTWF